MRLLFTAQALPSHYYTLQALARAARSAGHRVAVVAGAPIAELAERDGLEYHHASGRDYEHDVTRALELVKPHAIVSELWELFGPRVAEAHSVPAVSLVHGFPVPEMRDTSTVSRMLPLVFGAATYWRPGVEVPTHARYYRPAEVDTPDAVPRWLYDLAGRPVVYASLGTVRQFNDAAGYMRTLIDALGACDVHAVLTCGRDQHPQSLWPKPANVRVVQFVPQAHVMPRSALVVCHGGYGTVIAALRAGVPLVITPLGADQVQHARRCEAVGAAMVMHEGPRTTAAELASAIRAVLRDGSYALGATLQRMQLLALPPVEDAVQEIERFAGVHPPTRPEAAESVRHDARRHSN